MTVTGTTNGPNTAGAKTDLVTAYNQAAAATPTQVVGTVDIGGQTFGPGVYNSGSSIGLTGTVTLDARGDSSATFIFQAGSTLTTASASQVSLINGAQSCNVWWQVGSSATLGTNSNLRGTILALTSITVTTGVSIDGRALARNGAVTLDTNSITVPSSCSGAPVVSGSVGPGTSGFIQASPVFSRRCRNTCPDGMHDVVTRVTTHTCVAN